jgi:hypothetical protein
MFFVLLIVDEMAYSKGSTIKYMKAIGSYDETELGDALAKIKEDDVRVLYKLTQKLHSCLKTVHVENVEGKKPGKKNQTVKLSPEEKVQRLIKKIEAALDTYESTADVDKWNIEFTVGEHYGGKTFEQIKVLHDRLISAGTSIAKLKLLNLAERGRLYDFLKYSENRHGTWSTLCDELNVCKRTVDRYIDFYHVVDAYPRLLICDISFELIMTSYKQLNEYFNEHDSLTARLAMPLKQTSLSGGGIFSSRRMPGGGDEPQVAPEDIKSESASWDPAWQLADELFDDV